MVGFGTLWFAPQKSCNSDFNLIKFCPYIALILHCIDIFTLSQVTKHGLRGHIKEPVGTHGLLKAVFSAPIKQNDTVMLILYKRVYPKLPILVASNESASSSASQAPGHRQLVVV